jgi:mevalonate pyrophosphate decarboxylase
MKPHAKAVAYPGLPVVFAEGFRDYKSRTSGHSHASLAITDIHGNTKTDTFADLADEGIGFKLDGVSPQDQRSSGVYVVAREMLALATDRTGVRIESHNHSILTGSSDSGAAALVSALDDLLELGLPVTRLVEISRHLSETSYRSIIGGLSQFNINRDGSFKAFQLRKPDYFRDLMIYAVPFPGIKRFSADDLHKRVVMHKHYGKRTVETDKRLERLKGILDEGDLIGFMGLMEKEALTVQIMFSEMGMAVVKPEMKPVLDLVVNMRERGVQAYWNVAGGSCVYVFTLPRWAKEVTRELKDGNYKYRHFKVAEGAKPAV